MAVTGFIHHFGSFLLLAATVLLVVTSISAPVVHNLSLLTVKLGQSSAGREITFGTFGWCVIGGSADGSDQCSRSSIGYSPADIIGEADATQYSSWSSDAAEALTRVMILHPIAAGVSFIAFVLSAGAGMFGSLFAALVSGIAFLITVVALICDWVMLATIRRKINRDDNGADGSYAHYDVALWTLLAAAICLLLGTIVVFFTCCSGRLHKRRQQRAKIDNYSPPATHTTYRRRRWWQRSRH
ncbi:pH-response regulator [Colletotrichum eremochloae]|uniref:Putative pH-response regulator n=1 Tax=Colletotrichum sublineola TaxID=1173701 RepID=A0A066WSQ4_COLSU|nr:pH-response regulator [Colletotrichum sublineola]KAK2019134.1 pH-response regulator [Colletotrichum eremochloae]KDN59928.1 putative pH-response regulator [Colletotrichum sublineola]